MAQFTINGSLAMLISIHTAAYAAMAVLSGCILVRFAWLLWIERERSEDFFYTAIFCVAFYHLGLFFIFGWLWLSRALALHGDISGATSTVPLLWVGAAITIAGMLCKIRIFTLDHHRNFFLPWIISMIVAAVAAAVSFAAI